MVDSLLLEPPAAGDILRDHSARIIRLERGQESLLTKLAEISAEGRTRGEHQDRRADRDSERMQAAIDTLRAETRSVIAEAITPIAETQTEMIRQNSEIAGALKLIRNLVLGAGGLVSAVAGYEPVMAWVRQVLHVGCAQ